MKIVALRAGGGAAGGGARNGASVPVRLEDRRDLAVPQALLGFWAATSSPSAPCAQRINLGLHTAPLRVVLVVFGVRAGHHLLGRRPIFGRFGGLPGSGGS